MTLLERPFEAHGMVTREDVARNISQMIEGPTTYHQVYTLIEQRLARLLKAN